MDQNNKQRTAEELKSVVTDINFLSRNGEQIRFQKDTKKLPNCWGVLFLNKVFF